MSMLVLSLGLLLGRTLLTFSSLEDPSSLLKDDEEDEYISWMDIRVMLKVSGGDPVPLSVFNLNEWIRWYANYDKEGKCHSSSATYRCNQHGSSVGNQTWNFAARTKHHHGVGVNDGLIQPRWSLLGLRHCCNLPLSSACASLRLLVVDLEGEPDWVLVSFGASADGARVGRDAKGTGRRTVRKPVWVVLRRD
ncbi:hypothetical protein Cgig2_031071 [Carnegiea gigantea]|uniref:Uncharacterized protein n=1 Tax=Carnegiea gigantea TaxID=171969 RepID=A0A9Q1QG86_9CARY|nr:hypothetical protein Cgig2_031071 [Carnegiea gigantea]